MPCELLDAPDDLRKQALSQLAIGSKRQAGLLRMQQAGVILSDYATLMVEILKDNASPLAGPVYGALDMPWATLVGQIAEAYVK